MQLMRKQPSATQRRELSSSNRDVDKHPGSADSLLRYVETTGDFDFKDHNDGNHFPACEIDGRVAARTYAYLERKKQGSAASRVQLEAQQAQGHLIKLLSFSIRQM